MSMTHRPPSRDQSHQYRTSIAGWSYALADALEDYEISSADIFAKAGIELANIDGPDARLPVNSVQQVWKYATENTDDAFGLAVSAHLKPPSFQALGLGLHCSSTLLELLERLIRYRCVVSHMFFCELLEEDDCYRLMLVDERSVKSETTHDAFTSYVVRLARELQREDFSPAQVNMLRSQPSQALADFFATDIRGNSGQSSLLIRRDDMHFPLRYGNPELATQQDTLVERYISRLGLLSEYMLRVRNAIHEILSAGTVNIEMVADKLNVTVRTLQRRLSAEQSSYNILLDEVRHQLALEYASEPGASATEIGFRLGFSDSGSFGRSFKRWEGCSFTDFRSDRVNPNLSRS
jgi:AraC-like DNA-binding protein